MHRDAAVQASLFLPLLLGGCHAAVPADYLSCEGPIRPAAPSSAYAGRSIAELESLASNGDLAAARVLGERYQRGEGVSVDMKQAVRWYEQAAIIPPRNVPVFIPSFGKTPPTVTQVAAGPATPGDPLALTELGALYAKGEGVPQDPVRAQQLESCAASRGASLGPMQGNWQGPLAAGNAALASEGTAKMGKPTATLSVSVGVVLWMTMQAWTTASIIVFIGTLNA